MSEKLVQDHYLHALNICDTQKKIKLPSTDTKQITTILACEPGACFTYYDQQHTTGIDIKQMPNAEALVLVDGHTLHRDILQGVMRMRQLTEKQTLTVLLTQKFERILQRSQVTLTERDNPNSKVMISDLLAYAMAYQEKFVTADKIKSINAKRNNIYAQGIYKILNVDGLTSEQKHKLFVQLNTAYQTYLKTIDVSITKFFEQKDDKGIDILASFSQIIDGIVGEEKSPTRNQIDSIVTELKNNIADFNQRQNPTARPSNSGFSEHVGQSMEVEQVVAKQLITEVDSRREVTTDDEHMLKPDTEYKKIITEGTLIEKSFESLQDYQEIFAVKMPEHQSYQVFAGLKASPNFLSMFKGIHPLHYGSKPVHQLVMYSSDKNSLKAILITALDAVTEIEPLIKQLSQPSQGRAKEIEAVTVAIIDLFHPILPEKFQSIPNHENQFKFLMAKAYFINGNFDLAIKYNPTWVCENRAYLYEFATKHLKNIRQTTMAYITELESAVCLDRLMKRMNEPGKTAIKIKEVIDAFTFDALDPEIREQITSLAEQLENHEYCVEKLDALCRKTDNVNILEQDIDNLKKATQSYGESLDKLTVLRGSPLVHCSLSLQNRLNIALEEAKLIEVYRAAYSKLITLVRKKIKISKFIQTHTTAPYNAEYNQTLFDLDEHLSVEIDQDTQDVKEKTFNTLVESWQTAHQKLVAVFAENSEIITANYPQIALALQSDTIATWENKIQARKELITTTLANQKEILENFDSNYADLRETVIKLSNFFDSPLPLEITNATQKIQTLQADFSTFISATEGWTIEALNASPLFSARAQEKLSFIGYLDQKDSVRTQYQDKLAEFNKQMRQILDADAKIKTYNNALLDLQTNLSFKIDNNTADVQAKENILETLIESWQTAHQKLAAVIAENSEIITANYPQIALALQADTIATWENKIQARKELITTTLANQKEILENFDSNYADLRETVIKLSNFFDSPLPLEITNATQNTQTLQADFSTFISATEGWTIEALNASPLFSARAQEKLSFIGYLDQKDSVRTQYQDKLAELNEQISKFIAEYSDVAQKIQEHNNTVEVLNADLNTNLNHLPDLSAFEAKLEATKNSYLNQCIVFTQTLNQLLLSSIKDKVQRCLDAQSTILKRITQKKSQIDAVAKIITAKKLQQEYNTKILTLLIILSIATAAIFITLLCLQILPAMLCTVIITICTVIITISSLFALGFLISLFRNGNSEQKKPTVNLDLNQNDKNAQSSSPGEEKSLDCATRQNGGLYLIRKSAATATAARDVVGSAAAAVEVAAAPCP